jgi:hypothetical protein
MAEDDKAKIKIFQAHEKAKKQAAENLPKKETDSGAKNKHPRQN